MPKNKENKQVKALVKKETKKLKNVVAAVAPRKLRGRGKYTSKTGGLARSVGSMLGSLVGMPEIGGAAGDLFSSITGLGKYTVKHNTIATDSQAPTFQFDADGSIVVAHSELVSDVAGSVAFTNVTYDLDPTNRSTFPWLWSIVQNFEQYEPLGVVFFYKPTSGSAIASTNNALGTVVIATQYDVSQPDFSTKQQAESYEYSTSCTSSVSMIHPIECNPREDTVNLRYVRSGFVNTNSNSPNSVAGNLQLMGRTQVITVGQQAATTIGELWVSYKFRLVKPRGLPPSFPCSYQHYSDASTGGTPHSVGSNPWLNMVLLNDSTQPSVNGYPTLNKSSGSSSGTISFTRTPPNTTYLIMMLSNCSAGTTPGVVSTGGGLTLRGKFWPPASGVGSGSAGASGAWQAIIGLVSIYYVVTPANSYTTSPFINFDAPISASTLVSDLFIIEMPNPITNLQLPVPLSMENTLLMLQQKFSDLSCSLKSDIALEIKELDSDDEAFVKARRAKSVK